MKVLLLHGFTASVDTLLPLKKALEEAGYEVSLPTLRGHGTAPENLYGLHWRDWAADAREALLKLSGDGPNSEQVTLVGLSMGALLCCQLAAEHPSRVSSMALLAPAFGFRSPLVHLIPVLKLFTDTWPAQPDFADPNLFTENRNYREFPIEALEQVLAYIPVVEELLGEIEAPVAIFTSRRDRVVSGSVARKLRKRLKRADVTAYRYRGGGHEMVTDLDGAQLCRDLIDYLSTVG